MRYVFSSLGSLVFLMWSTQAQAIGNLSPASMGDWNGKTYDRANSIQQGYDIVVRQLGMAIANQNKKTIRTTIINIRTTTIRMIR